MKAVTNLKGKVICIAIFKIIVIFIRIEEVVTFGTYEMHLLL